MVAKLYHFVYILRNLITTWQITFTTSSEKACETLGGRIEKTSVETKCVIEPHNKGRVTITLENGSLKEIFAENELASTVIRYPFPGENIRDIKIRSDKKLVFVSLSSGNTCSFTRLPRIVRGSCVIDGRTVDFSFDP